MFSLSYDRWITLRLVSPLLYYYDGLLSNCLPILMYHSISVPQHKHTVSYYDTDTSPDQFLRQMQWLREWGYGTINYGQLDVSPKAGNDNECRKEFVITFDDGLRDFYINAYSILQKFGFSATVYLPTDYIGQTPRKFKGRECLTWGEIRELNKAGVCFGSHTVTHPQLWKMQKDEIRKELLDSRLTIEDALGIKVDLFAYPFAFPEMDNNFVKFLKNTLVECGYRNCATTKIGTEAVSRRNFFVSRLPINERDDCLFFRAKLRGEYNWVKWVQYVKKLFVGIK